LTVDDYYKNKSNFADPLVINNTIVSPDRQNAIYQDIKTSRSKYGRNEFNLEAVYIQSQDQANELMDWMMSRLIYPKQIVSIEVFGVPHLQLGDVIQIDYNIDNDNYVDPNKRFTVVNIDYGYSEKGPSSVIRVVEI
jgi:alpha-galactosidase